MTTNAAMESLRPARLDECIGQKRVRENLRMDIDAALAVGKPVKHLLFHGPPGLGKTTLSRIIATEMGSKCKEVAAPTLDDSFALVKILRQMRERDVLFVDEIHRLTPKTQETLYPALEDGVLTNNGRIRIKPFTFVGATTRLDLMSEPLRDRFGETYRMRFYEQDEMEQVVARTARLIGLDIDEDGIEEIARRSRGTPRIANRLTLNAKDYAAVRVEGRMSGAHAAAAMRERGIDRLGLTEDDRELLQALDARNGKPIGLDTLAAAISAEPAEVQRVHEPFLLRAGLMERTSKGRALTSKGRAHLLRAGRK